MKENNFKKINLLDCTLRDGGYYNNWDFGSNLVKDYLKVMEAIKVDYVELGFRFFSKNNRLMGENAYTTDKYIESLKIPKSLKLAVMINIGELTGGKNGNLNTKIKKLFNNAINSKVSLVRLAAHQHEISKAVECGSLLKKMGYKVAINLMQISEYSKLELLKALNKIKKYKIDILYFADSLGSLDENQTKKIVKIFKSTWDGPLGIHAHDNKNMALVNSLQALKEGTNWIDSTVTGMGRGPGNVKTEQLFLELRTKRNKKINLLPLLKLIDDYFDPLKSKFKWGSNPYYYLSALYRIHPTYIQELLSETRYTKGDLLAIIDRLKDLGGKKYNPNKFDTAKNILSGEPRGAWSPKKLMYSREILLLGSGPSIKNYKKDIENFINIKKPLVISLNTEKEINSKLIDFSAACHPLRLLTDIPLHLKNRYPLITPISMLPEDICKLVKKKKIFDYGLGIEEDRFLIKEKFCVVPKPHVIGYALAFSTAGKAKKIFLAGCDGYSKKDKRHREDSAIFKKYLENNSSISITSITPTNYNINFIPIQNLINI